ncbi:MAG TPA: HipA N-terminal domain-containing protein [Gammaproteobacteria bacterium]|nr:HipA N-terminal domain-containing protein [Gammaproteobacteria bacterium]
MRSAKVFFNKGTFVGILTEKDAAQCYIFEYDPNYNGPPVSLTMPIVQKIYFFDKFPAYFEGVLPEGSQLESLLRLEKLDRQDYFGQLVCVGKDLVGAFSVEEENHA